MSDARLVLGDPAAPVTITEFGDLECPYCRDAAPVLRRLVEESDGRVRLVWRHFPLFQVHPHALIAALAAEAAAEQGLFWEMQEALFAQQDRLTEPDLRAVGARLGLDPDLVAGPGAQRLAPLVEADYVAGLDLGVAGTPSLLVDGVPYRGRLDLASLRAALPG
ncbi:DsbA family protein [Cellulomonas triticagri]|uniref:DsbA family protein n=1 Tax=Cellulomonas triticagri TaxID=2483352 RepID=A0A3M2IT90_9CELL|nr:DsbA family protein [Cellulomonas triticagri]RMI05157.1 DsbA family protein [Cellulomonas triticagri]